jgi:hypothetical protein
MYTLIMPELQILPTKENKNILIMLANTGQCYAKLSYKSHKQYDQIQSGLTIPVIFFSTIVGTASFTGLSKEYYFYMSIIVGFVNILIGILTTVLRYFKISEYNEMYRVAHIAWDGYVREILLVLPNIKDDQFHEFYEKKIIGFNALVDTTPIFPKRTLHKFDKYAKYINNQYIKPAQINKQIVSIQTYIDHFKHLTQNVEDIQVDDLLDKEKCCSCLEKCCQCYCTPLKCLSFKLPLSSTETPVMSDPPTTPLPESSTLHFAAKQKPKKGKLNGE